MSFSYPDKMMAQFSRKIKADNLFGFFKIFVAGKDIDFFYKKISFKRI